MRILIVPSWYPTPGRPLAGIFIQQYACALAAAGHEVAVAYADDSGETTSLSVQRVDGVLTIGVGAGYVRSPSPMGKIIGVVAPYRTAATLSHQIGRALSVEGFTPDIVNVHALWPAGVLGSALALRNKVPFVVTEHSEEYDPATDRALLRVPGMLAMVLRPLAIRAARYVAPSQRLADRLMALRLAESVTVIPNIVPVREPAPRPVRAGGEPSHILSVSSMGPAKNIPLLLQAVAILRARRDDFVLDLVGDGLFRPMHEDITYQLELESVVRFHGALDTAGINTMLDECSLAVVSSDHETFSVFAAEALMAGRPVVSTRCGGPEEFVMPEVGMLVDAGSPAALADGLDWMLDHADEFDPVKLSAYAAERFAPRAVVDRYLTMYREASNE